MISMGTDRTQDIASSATLIPILGVSIFAAIARVPEGYEAPNTFYFACYLLAGILSVYSLLPRRTSKNTILTILTLISVTLFFGWNLKSRTLTRWVDRFPDDPFLIAFFNVLSLPVILYQYILNRLSLAVPWPFGLITSIFLLLTYWVFSARMLRRTGLFPYKEYVNADLSDTPDRVKSDNKERAGFILLALLAASIRGIPTLNSRIPAGIDTPYYVAALQGRFPPYMIGGFLRQLLYYLFRIIGIVLYLPFPTPLHSIWTVSIIPVLFHTITAVLTYNLVKSSLKDYKTGLLAGIFVSTSIGMLRVTWDLYKILLSIPFALISLQQLLKATENKGYKSGLLGLVFFIIAIACHITLGGVILLALSSYILIETLLGKGLLRRSRWALYTVLLLLVVPWVLGEILEKMMFTSWYYGNITSPLPNLPETGVISIGELFRWLGISTLLLAILGMLHVRRRKSQSSFPSIWLTVSFLLIEQALFHTYTRTGQLHRVELLTSLPVSILASLGVIEVLGSLGKIRWRRISFSTTTMVVLVLTLSNLTVAWSYGGFLSERMINEPEYISMIWLLNFAPNTNCGVPSNFDSWTGYYGQIQNYDLPTTFYIDRTATNDSPLYNRVYSGFNRIYRLTT